jgi:hypothetical protein
MLTSIIADSVKTLCGESVSEAIAAYGEAAITKGAELNRRGLYRSGNHILSLDELAKDHLLKAGDSILRELLDAHAAEPTSDMVSRLAQLTELLSEALDDAANRIWADRDSRLKPLAVDLFHLPVTPKSAVLPNLKAKLMAKLNVGAVAIANTRQTSVSNSINVSGPVGSIQTGSNSSASVTQTVAAPTNDEAARALTIIAEAIRGMKGEKSVQALELIDDLQAQVSRDKPNQMKVSSALGGLATMVQTIPSIGPAWDTVLRWSAALASLAA